MFDEFKTELIEFIRRSLDDIRSGRGERITGSYKYEGSEIEVYIDIKKE